MKIAVCLSGQPRVINEVYENHIAVLDNRYFDTYIHGWWTNDHQGQTKLFHSTEKFEKRDMGKIYVDMYKPIEYRLEDYKEFDLSFCKSHDYETWQDCPQKHYEIFTPSLLYGQLSQSQSIKESVEISFQKKYDVVVRSRPDVLYTKDIFSIMKNIQFSDEEIYFQSSMGGGHIYSGEFPNNPCDWFFCGTPTAMKKYTCEWQNVLKDYYSTGVKHGRDLIRLIAKKVDMKINLVDFGVLMYRQLTKNQHHRSIDLYYDEFDSSALEIVKNKNEWPHWCDKVDFKFMRNQK
jgi:hypothetical protein